MAAIATPHKRNLPFVFARNVCKSYVRGGQNVEVLEDLTLEVRAGEFLALMGPSGSGKTTLLNILGGLDQASRGEVSVGDLRIDRLSEDALAVWRSMHVGFVFQFYNLMPGLSAERNVELPLLLTRLHAAERRARVAAALELVELYDRRKHRPAELSGGQQQRVAIARAIVTNPELIICDEPTGDLDRTAADNVLDLLQLLNARQGKTIIMVTHDPRAAAHAGRILHLEKGRLAEPDLAVT